MYNTDERKMRGKVVKIEKWVEYLTWMIEAMPSTCFCKAKNPFKNKSYTQKIQSSVFIGKNTLDLYVQTIRMNTKK